MYIVYKTKYATLLCILYYQSSAAMIDVTMPSVKCLCLVLIELQPLAEGVLCLMMHDQCVIGEVEAV